GYLSGTAFTHEPIEALAAELAATLPGDLDKLYFLSSGSEAVEAALKLARQYWVERGLPRKHTIIALAPAYHGNTLLALSASARAARVHGGRWSSMGPCRTSWSWGRGSPGGTCRCPPSRRPSGSST